jgi:hypothetical protein
MLKTVNEVCDFIAEWCQETGAHAGQPLACDFAVPTVSCVSTNGLVICGAAQSAHPGPIFQYATPFLGLLGGQDKILNANDYARDENGVVPVVGENQGVGLWVRSGLCRSAPSQWRFGSAHHRQQDRRRRWFAHLHSQVGVSAPQRTPPEQGTSPPQRVMGKHRQRSADSRNTSDPDRRQGDRRSAYRPNED